MASAERNDDDGSGRLGFSTWAVISTTHPLRPPSSLLPPLPPAGPHPMDHPSGGWCY